MQKHNRAYSAFEFKRKYAFANEMQYSITREVISILQYTTVNMLVYLYITSKTDVENATPLGQTMQSI